MIRIVLGWVLLVSVGAAAFAQETIDLRPSWLLFEDGAYQPRGDKALSNTVYFKLDASAVTGSSLKLESVRPFFLFINGKLSGEFKGVKTFNLDSMFSRNGSSQVTACIFQNSINERELRTYIVTAQRKVAALTPVHRPSSDFKDFVILSGMIIIVFFMIVMQLNPKLSSDYFSVIKIFSPREADDAQSNARLTSSNNFQFYIGCSLLLAFYMMIVLHNLPDEYALPLRFQAVGFWSMMWQWVKLSLLILASFLLKIVIVFMLTRLFNMRGLARVHFFNLMRLLLVVFGAATVLLFSYYIVRGQSETLFVVFLSLVIATLIAWIFVVFVKLNGKTEHSMFHLFSYICATELIPLLITIKVLFQ